MNPGALKFQQLFLLFEYLKKFYGFIKGAPVLKYICLCLESIQQFVKMIKIKQIDSLSSDIWRVFISGSSQAGKTYFAKQLLKSGYFKYDKIYYFHPDIQEDFPIDWKELPVFCQSGLPTHDDLLDMSPYSVVILDDLFTEACKEKLISYLLRVLSALTGFLLDRLFS